MTSRKSNRILLSKYQYVCRTEEHTDATRALSMVWKAAAWWNSCCAVQWVVLYFIAMCITCFRPFRYTRNRIYLGVRWRMRNLPIKARLLDLSITEGTGEWYTMLGRAARIGSDSLYSEYWNTSSTQRNRDVFVQRTILHIFQGHVCSAPNVNRIEIQTALSFWFLWTLQHQARSDEEVKRDLKPGNNQAIGSTCFISSIICSIAADDSQLTLQILNQDVRPMQIVWAWGCR